MKQDMIVPLLILAGLGIFFYIVKTHAIPLLFEQARQSPPQDYYHLPV